MLTKFLCILSLLLFPLSASAGEIQAKPGPENEFIHWWSLGLANFGAAMHDDNLSLECLGPWSSLNGAGAQEYQCDQVLDLNGFAIPVRTGSTHVLRSVTITLTGALGNNEVCNLYFKSHDDFTDDTLCDGGGAGPLSCDDADVVLIPITHLGNETCGGNCTQLNLTGMQQTIRPVGATSTALWSLAVGGHRYCSYGAAEADGGDICVVDGDCIGTCVALDDAGGRQCVSIGGAIAEVRYSIID